MITDYGVSLGSSKRLYDSLPTFAREVLCASPGARCKRERAQQMPGEVPVEQSPLVWPQRGKTVRLRSKHEVRSSDEQQARGQVVRLSASMISDRQTKSKQPLPLRFDPRCAHKLGSPNPRTEPMGSGDQPAPETGEASGQHPTTEGTHCSARTHLRMPSRAADGRPEVETELPAGVRRRRSLRAVHLGECDARGRATALIGRQVPQKRPRIEILS
jgi:hypothetical protein